MNYPKDLSTLDIKQFIATCFCNGKIKTALPVNMVFEDVIDADGSKKVKKSPKGSKSSLTLEDFTELHEKGVVTDKTGKPFKPYISWQSCTHAELSLRANKSVYIIDIDDKNITWEQLPEPLKALPFTKSSSKSLPHFYFQMDGINHDLLKGGSGKLSLGDDNLAFCKGDLLISHAWETFKDGKIYNWDLNKSLPLLSWDIVKGMCKEETIKKVELTQNFNQQKISFTIAEPEAVTTDEDVDDVVDEIKLTGKCLIKLPKKAPVAVVEPENTIVTTTEPAKKEEKKYEFNKAKVEEKLRGLAECWKPERMQKWEDWRNFTWAIQNEFKEDTGMTIWDEISKKYGDTKYKNIENVTKWNELAKTRQKEGKKVNIGRLVVWAKDDNIDLYNAKFNQQKIEWDRLTEYTFAKRLNTKDFLGENILFTGSSKEMIGFRFNGTYWEDLGTHNSEIKKGFFDKLYNFYMTELEKIEDLLDEEVVKILKHTIKNLDSAIFRNHVIEILKSENYKKNIIWNKDNNLFAFEDCIYHLKLGKFIKPDPKQFINWTTGYAYGDTNNQYLPEQKWCKDFIHEIIGNAESELWLLKVLASFCKQENAEEKCHFWLGSGRNGKGTLTTLLAQALGQYFGELNLGYYTTYDKSPDAPNNNLYNLKYARVCNTSEVGEDNNDPDKPMRFITEKFKRITGGDKIVARQPHEKTQVEYIAGKTLIQTNLMPILVGIELEKNVSLRERPLICVFPYSFTDDKALIANNPDKYKLKDITLKEKFKEDKLKLGFVRLLLAQFQEYIKPETEGGGIKETELIKSYRMEYFDECNKTKRWFNEYLEIIPETLTKELLGQSRINVPQDLFLQFCQTSECTKKISKATFLKQLIDLIGKISAKELKSGVFTLDGIANIQGYRWKNKSEGSTNSFMYKKPVNPLDAGLDVEEEVEYADEDNYDDA